jgi:hypothetical protein
MSLGTYFRGVEVRKLDAKLRNFTLMSTDPISASYRFWGWAKTTDEVVLTVVNRLCQLIRKLEHGPHERTVAAAKFYDGGFVDAIPRIEPAFAAYVETLRIRLRTAIKVHEDHYGVVDPYDVAQMIGSHRKMFLWGPSLIFGSDTTNYDPLTCFIHNYCWNVNNDY